ncbi:DNA translocase FtsK [Desulfosporosinus burensis]
MSKRKKRSNAFWLKLMSIILLTISILGLLGTFGLAIGKHVYILFEVMLGSFTWAGPMICFVSAILLWIYAESLTSVRSRRSGVLSSADKSRVPKRKMIESMDQKSNQAQDKGISLPAGKLVSMKGFNQYFSSPEWVEMKDINPQKAEEMEGFGKDFPSYFGTGESLYPKTPSKLKSLKGLHDYFEEVDQEERIERSTFQQVSFSPQGLAKEPLAKQSGFSTVFKSQREQEEFLSRYKTDEHILDLEILDQEILDLKTADLQAVDRETVDQVTLERATLNHETRDEEEFMKDVRLTVDELGKMPQTQIAACSEPISELTLATDLINDQAKMEDTLKAPYAGQVAQLVEQVMKDKVEGVKVPQDVKNVDRVNHWKFPDINLMESIIQREVIQDTETPKLLEKVLLDFGVKAKVIRVTRGPVITRYELAPAPGVKISKIVNLSDDIALGLAARDVRIEAPIPGKAAIGIEVPNKHARAVPFREVLETKSFGEYPSKLKVALGKDIADQPIIADLVKMPHLLVAGATGAGKSVCITTIINSILFNATPDEVKFLLVDPKMVELSQYNGIPHLLAPVVVDPKKAASALKWIVKEMENRYELFAAAGVRDIERYNHLKGEPLRTKPALPLIVVIIDELADLMMVAPGEVEEAICRLAQMARAAGIHLVIATQRPSVDVITGVIKANIPSRISFAVSSQIDSRTILDATGAEKLLGRGDMLYSPLGVNKALRVQGCLVTDDEVQRVIRHWKGLGKPEYLDPERLFEETTVKNEETNGADDAVFIEAGQLFIRTGMASVSFLQRRLKLGYTRAARLMDMLEEQGVVGGYEGSKPRQVLLTLEEFNERFG